jgi:hypothetical protein
MPRLSRFLSVIALGAALSASLSTSTEAQAQPQPRQQNELITRGKMLFDDQQYEESIQTLSAALLRPGNTREQRIEIYRMLALDFITLNKTDEAESAVRGLLSLDPNYTLPESESPRFRNFFDHVQKKWEIEGKPGISVETGPVAPVVMTHNSPSEVAANHSVAITARLNDPSHRVDTVRVFYRTGTRGKFEGLDAKLSGGVASATIPASAARPPVVEYYIEGMLSGGLPIVSRGDADAPLRIAVPSASKGWVLPVAIGGGVLGAAAIIGTMALAGVFSSGSDGGAGASRNATVRVTVRE